MGSWCDSLVRVGSQCEWVHLCEWVRSVSGFVGASGFVVRVGSSGFVGVSGFAMRVGSLVRVGSRCDDLSTFSVSLFVRGPEMAR